MDKLKIRYNKNKNKWQCIEHLGNKHGKGFNILYEHQIRNKVEEFKDNKGVLE